MPDTNQPRLLSFTLDDWDVLGGRVSVSLTDGAEVLVGRNGAGKSAILEGFEAISLCAIGRINQLRPIDEDSIPKILEIEVSTPNARQLEYRYELKKFPAYDIDPDDFPNGTPEENRSWNEYCRYLDGEKELLWSTEAGVTTFSDEGNPVITILGDISSLQNLHLPKTSPITLPKEMQWIYAILKGVRLLGKTPARTTSKRHRSLLSVSGKGVSFHASLVRLSDILARKILIHLGKEEFIELESICQRVGIGSKITTQKFVLRREVNEIIQGGKDLENVEYIASVLLDGIDIGLLSDGTLRVLSILVELVFSSHDSSMTTIIEEPETQIHPGILAKLLNEIEAYTFGENLILSTHSPQVVAWTKPDKINLVARNNGRIMVRKLGEGEIHNVVEYLCEEGNLGEWIYSGILDD